MRRFRIISLGEVLWDLFPGGEKFGGAPANFACHAALQGADVAMVSAVGDDARGAEAIRILSDFAVDISLLQTCDRPTGTVGVDLDATGKPTYVIHEGSAWDSVQWNDEIAAQILATDAVCFGTLGQRCEVTRNTLRRAVDLAASEGIPRLVDINLRVPFFDAEMIRDSVRLASILKLSDEELRDVGSAFGVGESEDELTSLRRVLEVGDLAMVVMTRGASGATLMTHEGVLHQAGVNTEVIDTVGAGDAFTAAFLIEELQGNAHQDALRVACEVAAATCAHSGAVPT